MLSTNRPTATATATAILLCLCLSGYISSTTEGSARQRDLTRQGNISGVSTSCLPLEIRRQLVYISNRFGAVKVVSAHRPGALIAGTNRRSYHASCRAVDFYVRGRGAQTAALNYLRANWRGGLGTYSGCMHHIHLDNGPKVRFHHKVNCNGRRIK